MTQIQVVHQVALHMRELARDSELPGYVQKLERAADELEQLERHLKSQREPHCLQSPG